MEGKVRSRRSRLGLVLIVLVALTGGASAVSAQPDAPSVTHGIVVGDVAARSAVLWARADRAATLNVVLSGGGHGPSSRVQVAAEDDFTGRMLLTRLRPSTTYDYRVWFSLSAPGRMRGPVVRGSFRTAPADDEAAEVRLAFGGDIAGQNVCRDAQEGFPIMDTVRAWRPHVFVGLGDMIYQRLRERGQVRKSSARRGRDRSRPAGLLVALALQPGRFVVPAPAQ